MENLTPKNKRVKLCLFSKEKQTNIKEFKSITEIDFSEYQNYELKTIINHHDRINIKLREVKK